MIKTNVWNKFCVENENLLQGCSERGEYVVLEKYGINNSKITSIR
jgi:hypothetical protein